MEKALRGKGRSCNYEAIEKCCLGSLECGGFLVSQGCVSDIKRELKGIKKRFRLGNENDLLCCIKELVRLCLTQSTQLGSGNAFSGHSESISTESNLSYLNHMKNSINDKLDELYIGEIKISEHQKKVELKESSLNKVKNNLINEKKNLIENQEKLDKEKQKILKKLKNLQVKMKSMDLYLLNLISNTNSSSLETEKILKKNLESMAQTYSSLSVKNKEIENKSQEFLTTSNDYIKQTLKDNESLLDSLKAIELKRQESNTQLRSLNKSIKGLDAQIDSMQSSLASKLTQRKDSDSLSSEESDSKSIPQRVPASKPSQGRRYYSSLKSMIVSTKKSQYLTELETKLKKQQEKQKKDSETLHLIYENLERKRKDLESHKSEIIEKKNELSEIFKDWVNNYKAEDLNKIKEFGLSLVKKQSLHFKDQGYKITIFDSHE